MKAAKLHRIIAAAVAEALKVDRESQVIRLGTGSRVYVEGMREAAASTDRDGDLMLGGDLPDRQEVENGADGGVLRDSQRIDPRLRLVDYREVDGHRRSFINGVAEPLVRGSDAARGAFDGSPIDSDAAHSSPSVSESDTSTVAGTVARPAPHSGAGDTFGGVR